MSITKHSAVPNTERGREELLMALREHLSDEDAEMLAARMKTAERDEENSTDWPLVKRRILHRSPKS